MHDLVYCYHPPEKKKKGNNLCRLACYLCPDISGRTQKKLALINASGGGARILMGQGKEGDGFHPTVFSAL